MLQLHEVSPWRRILRSNFTNWRQLATFLELEEEDKAEIVYRPDFPLNLPLRLAKKIVKGTLADPILRQFLPTKAEEARTQEFIKDPVGDNCSKRTNKLLQKYTGRALLVCTSACAMHCRYCFRQNFDYDTIEKGFQQEVDQIAQDESLQEIILSGGDPLSLSDATLGCLLQELALIPHVKRVRFHTRFPIGIPERIDLAFLSLLETFPKQLIFVIHANHPKELDDEVLLALKQLQRTGAPLLNQSVLLKGVNDSVETLQLLSEKLVNNGILPYYLHQLDRVQGAAHFEVAEEQGQKLMAQLQKELSGYAVPRYVKEIAGEQSKTII